MITINKSNKTAVFTKDGTDTDLGQLTDQEKVSVAGLRRRARKLVNKLGLSKPGVLIECVVK